MQLFYVDGINATGVDLVAAQANVSKRTLYNYFPSKSNLVEHYLARVLEIVLARSAAESADPRERVLRLFATPESDRGRMRGCPFHNAAVEASGTMPDVADLIQRQKRDFAAAIVDLCRAMGAADPEVLGGRIALIYEGAAALSTSLDAAEPWVRARAMVELLLDPYSDRAARAPASRGETDESEQERAG